MTERTLREQIPEMVPSAREREHAMEDYTPAGIQEEIARAYRDGINAALSTLSSAPITDAEVEIVAKALAIAAHKHLLGAARWQKWTDDARAALTASRKWMAATPASKPEGE